MKPTIISLFAGIGGLDLAAHWAGFETVRFVEKEPFCQKVLSKHWPGVPIDDDVFTSHPGHADVVIGGFPCQPFSVAGAQKGKDDERYLLPEMLRIVSEVQPYAVLFENVPGFPSLNDGAEFKYLLRALAEMGFNAEWGHIRASDIGAPHQRERWFCVAYASAIGCNAGGDNRQERHLLHHVNGNAAQSEPKRQGWQCGVESAIEAVVNPGSTGREKLNTASLAAEQGFIDWGCNELGNTERGGFSGQSRRWAGTQLENGYTRAAGAAQSRLGGDAHGIPGWLDFVGFPAAIGQDSYDYEPPRTVYKATNRTARIKALGNAVVPQCAYPIFAALMEWFEAL